MKILLVTMEYDYGDPARGRTYDYYNLYQSLLQAGHEVELYDYMSRFQSIGKIGMNQELLERTQNTRPDLAIFSLYTDQFEPGMIDRLREYTKTLCVFYDDNWRVEYSRFWA